MEVSPQDGGAAARTARACAAGRRWRAAAVAGSIASYALLFPPLYARVAGGAAAASGIPILLAGVLLGQWWGAATGLATIPLHLVLFRLAGDPMTSVATHVAGGLVFAIIGGVVGRLRDLGALLRRSHAEVAETLDQVRRAQGTLAEREAQLALAQEVSHTGYWVVELATRRVSWSTELFRILGHDPHLFQASEEGWWERVHPEDRPLVERCFDQALLDGRDFQVEFRVVRRDGTVRWTYGRGHVLLDGAGHPGKVLGTVQDLTEQRELQLQLASAERLASVGTLAAGMAHEINNPLSYLISNLEFTAGELANPAPPLAARAAEVATAVTEALHGASRVRRIVQDLQAFSGADERSGAVDVEAALELSLRMAASELRHRARVVKEYGGVPPARGDPSRLEQVFLNLLLNAGQAIPPGDPDRHTIRIATRREAPDRIAVSISDTGSGMTDEVRRRIFEPFFTTRPAGSGMGLGLYLCAGIVRALHGDIAVESEPGRGSVFTVTLPVATREA